MSSFLKLALACAFAITAAGQDSHDWQALARLRAGDNLRLSLKTGPVKGVFERWTPEDVITATATARKEDVLRIERYRPGGGRLKRAAIGALIGVGAGFGIGAAADRGCSSGNCLQIVPRGVIAAAFGAVGAVVGGAIGALIPRHPKELIYASK